MSHPAEILYYIFLVANIMFFLRLLELIWNHDRNWALFVLVFPPILIIYIINNWDETKLTLAFIALLNFLCYMISVMTGYAFSEAIFAKMHIFSLWPYYLYLWVLRVL